MAGDRQVAVDVRAKVTGAKDVEKLARDVDKLTAEPATLEVDAKVNPAVDRVLGKLDDIDAAARAAAVAAEALGAAVGPELAARADMTAVVNELKRLGLSFDEITVNADELGDKLRTIDSDDLGGRLGKAMGTARGKTEELRDAAVKSRNAMANMVGNVTQDLGAFAGVAGTAGVAVGQLAEGAADAALGGQKLSTALLDVAKVAGPMAALGVAMQLLSSAMEAASATRAFDAANVDQYFDAIKAGTPIVQSFNDEIRETGELAYRTQTGGGPLGMFSSTQDLLPILAKVTDGIGVFNKIVDEYVAAGDGSAEANDRWRAELEAMGFSMLDAIEIVKAANQEADARTAATERNVRVTNELGDSEADQAAKAERAAKAEEERARKTELVAHAQESLARIQADAAAEYDALTQRMLDQAAALEGMVSASTTAADAKRSEVDALMRYAEVTGDAEASTDDMVDASIALAKAHEATADATARSEGATRSATAKVDSFNDALLDTAANLNGPARTAVANYIADVNKVPADKRTQFIALVESGKLEEARGLLDGVSVTRTAALEADATNTTAAGRELDNVANPGGRPRTAYINTYVNPAGTLPRPPGVPIPTMMPPADGAEVAGYAAAPAAAGDSYAVPSMASYAVVRGPTTVNVTLQSTVIGSPHAVARAVRRATHDAARLAGSR